MSVLCLNGCIMCVKYYELRCMFLKIAPCLSFCQNICDDDDAEDDDQQWFKYVIAYLQTTTHLVRWLLENMSMYQY